MTIEEALKTTKFKGEEHKAILNVLYTAYCFKAHNSELLKEYNLTGEQYNVMRILKGKHPQAMCVKDIGSRVIEKNSNVPRIIERMVAKGIVIRNISKQDRRESLIGLTLEGIKLLDQANKTVADKFENRNALSDTEAKTLNYLLEKIRTF